MPKITVNYSPERESSIKKLIIFFAVLVIAFLFTGCSDSTELGNRAIIQAAAIDYDRANGGYKVSALLFSSGGSGGDTIDASQENVIKVQGTGKTLSEAVDNISLIDGKKIYMCETKLLILGSGFENTEVSDALDTLYYDLRCSLNMPVCYAENAEILTDLQFKEGVTAAEKPLSMIENAHELGAFPKTTLLDLLADRAGARSSLIPMFELAENGRGMTASDDGKTAVLSGSRRLSKGRFTDSYDREETAGLMLISGITDKIMLNYFYDGSEKTCEAFSVKVIAADNPSQRAAGVKITAKFRSRNGTALSEDERKEALRSLTAIVEKGL